MKTARTCEQCGTGTGRYVECCEMVLCINNADPRCCAERHFEKHTWCELCLQVGERSLATHRRFLHEAFVPVTCRNSDLCEECAAGSDSYDSDDPPPCILCGVVRTPPTP